jgi:hypothetical protein
MFVLVGGCGSASSRKNLIDSHSVITEIIYGGYAANSAGKRNSGMMNEKLL